MSDAPAQAHATGSRAGRLYALFWRWHFITGFFAAPILAIVALTGAALVFQDEVHPLVYPHLDLAAVTGTTVSLDAQLAAVQAAFPHDEVSSLTIYPPGSGRTTVAMLHMHNTGGDWLNPWNMAWAYVDPGTGEVVGSLTASQDIFEVVTTLHKSFFALLPGQLLVDLATSWGVISILAGLYLWWPRRASAVWGVWLPRLRGGIRLILRDLHTVPALYFTPVALVVSISGVLLGLSAAPEFLAVLVSGQLPQELLFAPKSEPAPGQPPATLESVVGGLGPHPAHAPYVVAIPHDANSSYMVWYAMHADPEQFRQAVVDQYSGEITVDYRPADIPLVGRLYYVLIFNEVLHRGTYWGLLGKVLTFLASLLVAGMCVTAVWLWWLRTGARRLGIPRVAPDIRAPRWASTTLIISVVLLPLTGLSWLVLAALRRLATAAHGRFARRFVNRDSS